MNLLIQRHLEMFSLFFFYSVDWHFITYKIGCFIRKCPLCRYKIFIVPIAPTVCSNLKKPPRNKC